MKNSRKLLVSSLIMIISFCLLFAGTTFAWFSDSVTSGNNIITAGNLDVELEYSTDGKTWSTVESDTSIFKEENSVNIDDLTEENIQDYCKFLDYLIEDYKTRKCNNDNNIFFKHLFVFLSVYFTGGTLDVGRLRILLNFLD